MRFAASAMSELEPVDDRGIRERQVRLGPGDVGAGERREVGVPDRREIAGRFGRNAHRFGVAEHGRDIRPLCGSERRQLQESAKLVGPGGEPFRPVRMADEGALAADDRPRRQDLRHPGDDRRAAAVAGQVVLRPMMYLALTYDHRIVDGAEAVRFLVRIKALVEDPAMMLVES